MRMDDYPDMAAQGRPCVPWEQTITGVQIAHAYVPWQRLCGTFMPMQALKAGTAFPELTGMYLHTYEKERV